MQFQSKACCTRPPITVSGGYDYQIHGEYMHFDGMKTYVTGRPNVKRGIFLFYDVFGLYIQALKGADILASDYPSYPDNAGNFKVFMPDWWGDDPQDLSIFPPKTPAQTQKIMAFFDSGPANPDKQTPKVKPLIEAIRKEYPEITEWAVLGFCWGGKMTALFSGPGTMFKAAAQCHPSLVDVKDVSEIKIPMCILPSMDENIELLDEYAKKLSESSPNSYLEFFDDQPHGWMTSRADFNNLHAYEEYLRGYRIVRTFFDKYI